jgi:hypothetical protein
MSAKSDTCDLDIAKHSRTSLTPNGDRKRFISTKKIKNKLSYETRDKKSAVAVANTDRLRLV